MRFPALPAPAFVSSLFTTTYAPDTARTCNLQFRRLSLYPVELRVLSIADVDHMTQPGFGKTKMQLLKPGNRVQQAPLRLRCRLGTLCSSGCTALTGSQKHGSSSLPSVALALVHRLKPPSSDSSMAKTSSLPLRPPPRQTRT